MPISRHVRTTVRTVSAPFSCPLTRFNRRFLAQRPLPSMIIATWTGNWVASRSGKWTEEGLEFKDYFLYVFKAFVDQLDLLGQVSLAGGNIIAEDLKSSSGSFLDGQAFVCQKLDHDGMLTLARVVDFSLSVSSDDHSRPAALLLSSNDTDYLMLLRDTMLGIDHDRLDIQRKDYTIFSWKKLHSSLTAQFSIFKHH